MMASAAVYADTNLNSKQNSHDTLPNLIFIKGEPHDYSENKPPCEEFVKSEPPNYYEENDFDAGYPYENGGIFSEQIGFAADFVKAELTDFDDDSVLDTPKKGHYPCRICKKVFKYTKSLRRHIAAHGDGGYTCEVCKRKFILRGKYITHECEPDSPATAKKVIRQQDRPPHTYHCKICVKDFITQKDYREHQPLHFDAHTNTCRICDKVFKRRKVLIGHMSVHSSEAKERRYSCAPCGKFFSWKKSYRIHMDKHRDISYGCKICGKTFSQKGYLSQHRNIHSDVKKYVCMICDRSFAFKRSLIDHMLAHTGIKLFSCEVCHKGFMRREHRNRHRYTHSELDLEFFRCDHCEKNFSSKQNLIMHIKQVEALVRFRCSNCPRTFSWRKSLEKHKRLYETRTNACHVCHMMLPTLGEYKLHMKRSHPHQKHAKQRKFIYKYKRQPYHPCQCCDLLFRTEEGLRDHKRTMRTKCFTCDVCQCVFTSKCALEEHMDIHCTIQTFTSAILGTKPKSIEFNY